MITPEVFHLEVLGPHVPESLAFRLYALFLSLSDETGNGKEQQPEDLMTLDVKNDKTKPFCFVGPNRFLFSVQARNLRRDRADMLRAPQVNRGGQESSNAGEPDKRVHNPRSRTKFCGKPPEPK
jgi:hypothetical protein